MGLVDEQKAALIIFPLALIGVTANWTVALLIRKIPSLKNSFGRLTASQSMGDALHSTLFAFYFVPMCFLFFSRRVFQRCNTPYLSYAHRLVTAGLLSCQHRRVILVLKTYYRIVTHDSHFPRLEAYLRPARTPSDIEVMKTYSMVCGHLLLIAYDISTYSHFCISLNRFCSIVAPIKYDTIFSMSNTKKLIILSWSIAIVPSFYLYIYHDCKFYYIDDFWVFTFSTTSVCLTITWYADFLKYNSLVLTIVLIDVVTVCKVRSFKSHLSKTVSALSHQKRKNSEMNFLKQACLQAFVFVCELVTYFLITPRVEGEQRWLRFFLSTFAWVCVHMLDGIITLAFNKEFTQTIFRGIKIKDLSGAYATTSPYNKENTSATMTARH